MRMPSGAGRYGYRLAARDFNKDGIGDLVVGAPGVQSALASGAVQLIFGSPTGLQIDRPRTIRRPDNTYVEFGSRLRAGDIDSDGNLDLVEGSPDRPEAASSGHRVYCRGTPDGAEPLPAGGRRPAGAARRRSRSPTWTRTGSTTSCRETPIPCRQAVVVSGGEVRLWRGGRRGPAGAPRVITRPRQSSTGADEPGDEFGGTLDAGDVDDDGYADMIVGAPGEENDTGAVTVIRGGRDGWARTGNSVFGRSEPDIPGTAAPGDLFGWSVATVSVSGDDRLDLAVMSAARSDWPTRSSLQGRPTACSRPARPRHCACSGWATTVAKPQINRIRIGRPGDS